MLGCVGRVCPGCNVEGLNDFVGDDIAYLGTCLVKPIIASMSLGLEGAHSIVLGTYYVTL